MVSLRLRTTNRPEHPVETREIKRAIAKRTTSRVSTKGMVNRRITKTEERDGRVYKYHATKGWRSYAGT